MAGKPHLEVLADGCRHCADSGMARYYVHRDRPWQVYLAPEALGLPDAIMARLRMNNPICDCEAGQRRPERRLTTRIWHKGAERAMTTYSMLEVVRAKAARRHEEARDCGVVDPERPRERSGTGGTPTA